MGMKEWAQLGAAKRVEEITRELEAIRQAFPGLSGGLRAGRRVSGGGSGGTLIPEEGEPKKRGRRNGMTSAQRNEVSRRMKAYWASKRSAKK